MKGYSADLSHIHEAGFSGLARAAAKVVIRALRAAGIEDGLVVDLGCGGGTLATALLDAGYDVLGLDVSPSMVRLARNNEPRATFRVASFRATKLPSCVAIVAVGEVLSYLFDRGVDTTVVESFIAEAHRALRTGGVLIFDVLETMPFPERRDAWTEDPAARWAVLVRVRESRGIVQREIVSFRRFGRQYRRTAEVHRQRRYSRERLQRALEKRGFQARALRGYGTLRFRPGQVGFLGRKR